MPDTDLAGKAPSNITRLIQEADTRIRAHLEQMRGQARGFVASDFALVNKALERIAEERLAPGPLFCEWGSGFGVVAMLASMHGFDACGIEVQSELVLAAEQLAGDVGCDVRFALGSFLTAGDEDLIESAKHSWWHTSEGTAYEDLDLEPEEFDVFFGYPWPGEEELFDRLFVRHASVGALLLTYHDATGVLVQRKTRESGVPDVIGWY